MDGDFRLGAWLVQPGLNTVSRNETRVHLEPKVMGVLVCLAARPSDPLTKEELLKKVWSDTFVTDDVLARAIYELRRVFGDDAREPQVIQTIPKRGYRLIAPVVPVNGGSQPAAISATQLADVDVPQPAPRNRKLAFRLAFLALALPLLAGAWTMLHRRGAADHPARLNPQNMKITEVTVAGSVRTVGISRDGRYLAYVRLDPQPSLWVRQVASGSEVQVVPPTSGRYISVAFSPDGDYLYFVRDNDGYVVPVLGGMPKLIIHDTQGGIAVSPDGRRLAYYHGFSAPQSELIVANADGTGAHVIAHHARASGIRFGTIMPPSWSPDGKLIAQPVFHEADTAVYIYPVDGGRVSVLSCPGMLTQALWLPDQSGLLVTADPTATSIDATVPAQIWFLPFPEGPPQRLTHDLDAYRGLSVTADGHLLAAVLVHASFAVYVGPASDPDHGKAVNPGTSDGIGLKWMPDGSLLSQSLESELSLLRPEGGKRVPLFQDDIYSGAFSVCDHGRFFVFMRENWGDHSTIWRVDATGRNPKQLTNGPDDLAPLCSPDGRSITYLNLTRQGYRMMRVPADGGLSSVWLETGDVAGLRYSRDGREIADIESGKDQKTLLVIRDSQTGAARKTFRVFTNQPDFNSVGWNLQWAPDGRSLTYILERDSAVNLWSQPLSGGPPHQITHFPDRIVAYEWSPDGKRFAVTRMTHSREPVLISDFR